MEATTVWLLNKLVELLDKPSYNAQRSQKASLFLYL